MREKMSHPTYKPPPPALFTKVAKGGAYLRDTTVFEYDCLAENQVTKFQSTDSRRLLEIEKTEEKG